MQNLELCVTHCRICGHRIHHRLRLSIHEWLSTKGEKTRPRGPERKTIASEKQDRCTDLLTPHESYSLGEAGSKKVFQIWNYWNIFSKDVSKFAQNVTATHKQHHFYLNLQWKTRAGIIYNRNNISCLYIPFSAFREDLHTQYHLFLKNSGTVLLFQVLEETIIISVRHESMVEKAQTRH